MATQATEEELAAGRGYEALFVPALFAPWSGHLVNSVAVHAGAQVLDIACGSGVLARTALDRVGPSGRVVGLDPAPGMIGAAKEVEPRIDWVLGGAEHLPFGDATFDYVLSQFGMMFFNDRAQACSEMFRVTRPGGKVALAIWHGVEENPAYRDIAAVLEDHVSAKAAESVRIPFCLGNPDPVAGLLSDAGFGDVTFETLSKQATFPSPRMMVEVELRGWLPMFGIHLNEEEIAEVLASADTRLSRYATTTGEAVFQTSAYVITAQKPGAA
ncbi:class I SAM-dependent methyltransferase [Sulfitobacter aestuariivivens]|uniref:Methyltransferase domain-containing protein n=1 Tax=Sulfitobacter aestuariivivens TaxID=2766981 RepID=A0A927HF33_9RHOB|nr:methyltransferase domain-containing protein [Sulfitobacter aestuariivivens]MBD3662815.1 methyltransferase domain-containing protein [Sulfitobacter aestuariivivens]